MSELSREAIEERLHTVRRALEEAADGRWPVPKLIAVTKTHPVETILPLREMGVTEIGENRVQELRDKLPALRGAFHIHLIGRLQCNKVKYLTGNVSMIHSLDSLSLAHEIDRQAQKNGTVMPALVEVSPAGEPQKGGIAPEELPAFLRAVSALPGVKVCGLMAVMPNTDDTAYLDGLFGRMRQLFESIRGEAIGGIEMEELSMGMSHDYRLAAAHGATMVRIGSALFGPRG